MIYVETGRQVLGLVEEKELLVSLVLFYYSW